ncbi:hypothetical protein FQR65_LT09892 [Abscondita terminalis]|nr:hypothetical protein FQR65_LT09892 [Abscondita terminalis]
MIFTILLATTIFLLFLYKLSTWNYDYWKKRNVPHIKPIPFFGNFIDTFTLKSTMGEALQKLHQKIDMPYFGAYVLHKPFFFVKDLELIKHVLVKDFDHFSDRYVLSDEQCDPITSFMLFFSKNPEWKYMRNKITPILTSGKMKNMFPLIKEMGTEMTSHLTGKVTNEIVEAKEISTKYATNVITSCAFGLNANSFQNQDSPFYKYAKMMFDTNLTNGFNQGCYFLGHTMVKLLRAPFFDREILSFMRIVFWKTIEERERSLEVRNDLIDVMKEFKQQTYATNHFKFEGDKVLAQAAQFYSAGFETVSSTISFALYEISFRPEIQNRLRSEIKQKIAEYKEMSYACVDSMTYLSMVVDETLRKYPVLPFLERKCVKDYKVPNTDLVISNGTPVYISLLGLHHDPTYYPNPEEFDPERFSENRQNIVRYSYLPFGDGQRNCLGARFGLMSTKVGLLNVILNFEISPCPATPRLIKFSPKSIFLSSSVGIPLNFKRICVDI